MAIASIRAFAVALFALGLPTVVHAQWFGKSPQLVTGEEVYRHVCQSCHMDEGQGAKSPVVTVPALANNPTLATSAYPIIVVLNGKAAMPWFNGSLTPAQIAAVVGYVRTHFGNHFPEPVTEEEVKRLAGPVPRPER